MTRETEQTSTDSAPEGKYVYCIIETGEPRSFGPMGIGGRGDDVYTIQHRGLAAVSRPALTPGAEPVETETRRRVTVEVEKK